MTRWRMRVPFVAVAAALVAIALAGTAGSGANRVVLGRAGLLRGGTGWGTAAPATIFNGGDPSGRAFRLRWSGWGTPVAYAHGLTWVFRRQGGYYEAPGAIELRASRIGKCVAGGPPAYTRLAARVATHPGGPLGRWFAWGGWTTICRRPG